MKRIILLFSLVLSMSLIAGAQDKPANKAEGGAGKTEAGMPSVDQILDKLVKAIGGKQAMQKHQSRTMKGVFDIEAMNMSGSIEIFAKAPNKASSTVSLPGVGDFVQVFDGEKAWNSNPMEGLRELSGTELSTTKRRSDFYSELNMRQQFTKFELKGKDKVGESEVYVVEGTPTEGGTEKFYFSVDTGLLLRHDFESDSPQGKVPTEVYMSDYQDSDGIKVPMLTRQVTPMFEMKIKISEIKNNVEIEDTKFAKPAAP